jgi:hypothetical protein
MGAFLFLPGKEPMMQGRRNANSLIPDRTVKLCIRTRLHTELGAARTEHESASERYTCAAKWFDDLRLKDLGDPQPGVKLSVCQAAKTRRKAFEDYCRALDSVNRFILCRDLPELPEHTVRFSGESNNSEAKNGKYSIRLPLL